MAATGLSVFDATIQKTNVWLNDMMEELGTDDRHRAYSMLRAGLHALRDNLTIDQAAHLGAQMPMLVRGMYYDGWHPATSPARERTRDSFLHRVAGELEPDEDSQLAARATFAVLQGRISEGEIDNVVHMLAAPVRELWP